MRANHSDHHLYEAYSLNSKSEKDTISCASLNLEQTSNLHYIPSNTNNRRTSTKRVTNTVNHHNDSNGLVINGSLFDKQLFQTSPSSYILDYSDKPKELNRFMESRNMTSGSACLDPHLFKISFIITLSEWHVDKELLLDYCPRDNDKKHIIEELSYYKRFCFPELNSKHTQQGDSIDDSSTYIFTRTNSNGHAEYGYCRRISHDKNQMTKFPIVICIVSTYSYFKLYDAILSELASVYISNELECGRLMNSFYSQPLPIPTTNPSDIVYKLNNHRVLFYVCPYDDRLNHDYFSTLLSCLSPNYIVHLFESMLRSKKILCFSNSLSKLTKCCLALSFLLYPFLWPYSFVSLMPSSWSQDLFDSPCPYIYGCLYETLLNLPSSLDKDALRVDLDLNTIDIGLDDGIILPLDLRQTFQASLEYIIRFRLSKSNSTLVNIAVSEACLHIFIQLLYRLPDFYKRDQVLLKSTNNEAEVSVCFNYVKREDSGIDLQSVVSNDIQPEPTKNGYRHEEMRLGYEFRSDEFLISQPSSSYVNFLNDFIRGMIFLKFLDDYERVDNNNKQPFALFSQRISERRRMTMDELSINPLVRFRQTFDLLEKEIKQSSKSTTATFSKIKKFFFE